MNAVVYTLAHYQARQRVKEQIRKEGKKLLDFKHRDIVILANMHQAIHAEELAAEALQTIQRSQELKKLYEKEERRRLRAV
jgi:hypothetical protein